jgi:hypothetical protein
MNADTMNAAATSATATNLPATASRRIGEGRILTIEKYRICRFALVAV